MSVRRSQNNHHRFTGGQRTLLLDVLLRSNTWLKRLLSDYLSARDATEMSSVCAELRLLETIVIPNGNLASRSLIQRGSPYFYGALKWFTLPIHLPSVDIHTVSISGEWMDQGWGNRKGMLSVVANNGRAPSDHEAPCSDVVAYISPAPHRNERFQLSFNPDESHHIDEDDLEEYTLWTRVGGGGGHTLSVRDLSLRIFIYKDVHCVR